MSSPTSYTDLPFEPLADLIERCRDLSDRAFDTIESLPEEREDFLARNLEDALQQVELILRVIEEEAEGSDASNGFFRRFTKGLARSGKNGETASELPDLHSPQQGLQGNTWTISLPELLGFLASAHKTGVLWVDGPEENYLIGLIDGELMHAASDCTPEGLRMGEVLVGHGYLTRRQLERFLAAQLEDEVELSGEALIESGLISDDELQAALNYQVQQLFHRLLETRAGIFRFREGMQITTPYQVRLNVTQLLLESAVVRDEMVQNQTLRNLVGSLDEAPDGEANSEQWDSWKEAVLSELSSNTPESIKAALPGEATGEGVEVEEASEDAEKETVGEKTNSSDSKEPATTQSKDNSPSGKRDRAEDEEKD